MLRLASSSSKVLRAIATSRILSGSTANASTASYRQFVKRKIPNFISHNFSTEASKSIDRKLVKALKSEIKSHQLSLVPAAPADFPFTIHDEDDDSKEKGKLTRELNGEKIYVSIAMPNIIQEDLSSVDSSSESDLGVRLPEPLDLYVRIGKENGKLVDFGVTICPHGMQVHTMSVMEPAPQSHGQKLACPGVHDVAEEGELQSALQEYLKVRGIKPCYAEFMYKYMVWKSKQSTLNLLSKIKKLIKD